MQGGGCHGGHEEVSEHSRPWALGSRSRLGRVRARVAPSPGHCPAHPAQAWVRRELPVLPGGPRPCGWTGGQDRCPATAPGPVWAAQAQRGRCPQRARTPGLLGDAALTASALSPSAAAGGHRASDVRSRHRPLDHLKTSPAALTRSAWPGPGPAHSARDPGMSRPGRSLPVQPAEPRRPRELG